MGEGGGWGQLEPDFVKLTDVELTAAPIPVTSDAKFTSCQER